MGETGGKTTGVKERGVGRQEGRRREWGRRKGKQPE